METIRMTVLGAGEWVRKYHLPAILKLSEFHKVEITGIWNRTFSKAEEAAAAFGIKKVYRDLDEAADERETDCFCVVLAPEIVFDVIVKIAGRRLPVFCEKPPGNNALQARRLAEIVKQTNLVAFNRRYVPLVMGFQDLVRGAGKLDFVECHFIRRGRTIPDFMTATGVHGLNLMEYLFGPIRRARLVAGTGTEDDASPAYHRVAELTFTSGLSGIAKFIPAAGVAFERIEAHGPGNSLYLNLKQHYTDEPEGFLASYADRRSSAPWEDHVREDPALDILERSGFIGEYDEFFRALRSGGEIRSTFQNAWPSVAAAEALQERNDYLRKE